MAELSTIARPYADALFQVAQQGDLSAWTALVDEMAAVSAHADMRALMLDPKVSDEQLYQVFSGVVPTPLQQYAQNFLRELIAQGRLQAMPEVAVQFKRLKNAHEGVADAEISSAFPLEAAALSDLVMLLEKKFNIKLRPIVTVDSSLIGGVRVKVGDEVLDTSVRARLEQMKTALTT
jgi:F-type H+-transporting ATPase subunit delta